MRNSIQKIVSLFPGIILILLGLNTQAESNLQSFDTIVKRFEKIKSSVPVEYNQYVQAHITRFLEDKDISTKIGKGLYLNPEIEKILKLNKLPIDLQYLPFALSDLDYHKVSDLGNSGIWLIKYHVAKSYGLKINSYIDERRDPVKSTIASCEYFQDIYKIYEDWNLSIAAFYSSPLEVNKAIRQSGGKLEYWKIHSYLPEDVQDIVPRFIASLYLFKHFRDHKIKALAYKTIPTDTVTIKNWTSFEQINKITGIEINFLREYNPIFKKNIIPYAVKKYVLNIPKSSVAIFRASSDSLYVLHDKEPGLVTMPSNGSKDEDSVKVNEDKPKNESDNSTSGYALLYYKVKRGESLGKIAAKYDVSVSQLKKWNHLRSDLIRPAQKLKVYVPRSKLSYYKRIK